MGVTTSIGTASRGNAATRTDWMPHDGVDADVARSSALLLEGLSTRRVERIMNDEGRR
mgnify:CR=1 FL=1